MTGMEDLAGKRIIVTGAGSGVGRATAIALAAAGARVCLVARSTEGIEVAAATIREQGGEAMTCPCDVADETAVGMMIAASA
ncbi:MAG: SDR family NAD(P)-dependent oxidoreductase, partial [Thermomicrobiales bacterium]